MNTALVSFSSPHETRRLSINVHERTGFTEKEIESHKAAMALLEVVLNSVQFYQRLMNHPVLRTAPLTREQLYLKIMSGSETIDPVVDYEMDLYVEVYYDRGKVVGYTNESTVKTWLNRYFFSGYGYADIACNAFHEWLHKLGFDHYSASDSASTPYALGYLVRDMVNELMAGAKFDAIDGESMKMPELPPAKELVKVVRCKRAWWLLGLKRVCYVEYV